MQWTDTVVVERVFEDGDAIEVQSEQSYYPQYGIGTLRLASQLKNKTLRKVKKKQKQKHNKKLLEAKKISQHLEF